jgi:hypothetical protein
MATKALAAKGALFDKLNGLSDLSDVQRTWGFPNREPRRKWCHVGEIRWESSEWMTHRSRQELFSITLVFSLQLLASSAEESETAVHDLADGAEDALKADPTLGLADVVTSDFVPRRLASWPTDDGYEAQMEIDVRFTARL